MLHDREVVRHEQVGEPEPGLDIEQQREHAGLRRHVQRRDRFVEQQDLRLHRQGAGDGDALALPGRELVGVTVAIGHGVEADLVEHLVDPPLALGTRLATDPQRLGDGRARGHQRVEGGGRVLVDDLHAPPVAAPAGAVERADVVAPEPNGTGGGPLDAEEQPRQRRLAAARRADEPERGALVELDVDAADGVHDAAGAPERSRWAPGSHAPTRGR